MTHSVVVREFEGPLGLLLELVERGRMEVTAIAVSEVTSQYLARTRAMPELEAQELSEFLELGCRLLYIKSLALLPRADAEQQAEELHQLNLELDEYRKYQQAARTLAGHHGRRTWQRTADSKLLPEELPMPELDLATLATAFQAALKRAEPIRPSQALKRHISQAQLELRLKARLREGSIDLQLELDKCADRLEIIVLFTALLELIRGGLARVVQASQFAPIRVEPANV